MTLERTIRELNEKLLNEKLGYGGSYQRKSKYQGKEFNKTKELKQVYKIQNALVKLDKLHSDLQYPNTVDTVTRVWEKLNDAYIGLNTYSQAIKDGKYDGTIDND
tara:strand:+ start:1030 stop:1344 length:315 start_codon:yes stop_codon:yes gene_type:complete